MIVNNHKRKVILDKVVCVHSFLFGKDREQPWTTANDLERPQTSSKDKKQLHTIVNEKQFVLNKVVCGCSRWKDLLSVTTVNNGELPWTTNCNFKQPKTTINDHEWEVVLNNFVFLYSEMILNDYKRPWLTVNDH